MPLGRDCAECKAFGTGPLSGNCSVFCNQTTRVLAVPAMDGKWCKVAAEDGRLLIYLVEEDETGGITLTVKSREGEWQESGRSRAKRTRRMLSEGLRGMGVKATYVIV